MVISLMAENSEGTTPSTEDLGDWAGQYGLTTPVLADEGWSVNNRFEADGGIPTMTLLAPGAEVILADEWVTEADIEAVLPE
jgi:hypothetical protein